MDHTIDPTNARPTIRVLMRRGFLFGAMPVTPCSLCAALVLTCGMERHKAQHIADARRDTGGRS